MKKYEGLKRILSIASLGGILLTGCSNDSIKTVTIEINGQKSVLDVNSFTGDGNGNYYVNVDGSLDGLISTTTNQPMFTFPPIPPIPTLETTEETLTNPPLQTTEATLTNPTLSTTEATVSTTQTTTVPTTTVTTTTEEILTNPALPQETTVTTTTEETLTNPPLPGFNETVTETYSDDPYMVEQGLSIYVVKPNDTLYKIANIYNTSYQYLMEINGLSDYNIYIGQPIKVPVTNVYFDASGHENYSEVSYTTGIPEEVICKLNNVSAQNKITNKKVLVQELYGNNKTYDIAKGNNHAYVVGNTVIFGKKIVYGYGEANGVILSLFESYLDYGYNFVVMYKYNENGKLISSYVCNNAEDIEIINGIPVAYCRTANDIASLAQEMNISVDSQAAKSFATENINNYPIYADSNNDSLITYDGNQHGFGYANDNYQYIKTR